MDIKTVWNGINQQQRKDLIVSIYNSDVFFIMFGSRPWDELPAGIQRGLRRLWDVYKARKTANQ
jgi:hypothetical protein